MSHAAYTIEFEDCFRELPKVTGRRQSAAPLSLLAAVRVQLSTAEQQDPFPKRYSTATAKGLRAHRRRHERRPVRFLTHSGNRQWQLPASS